MIIPNKITCFGVFLTFTFSFSITAIFKFNIQNQFSFDNFLITAITLNDSKRALPMYYNWGEYVKKHSNIDNVFLVSNNGCPKVPLTCIKPTEWYSQSLLDDNIPDFVVQFRDVISKRLYSMEKMLSNNAFEWLLSVTDDVKINIKNLPRMIKILNFKYKPRDDVIVKGNGIDLLSLPFLQGGSGFIISRKAAEEILKMKHWILYDSFLVDDMRFSEVWKRLGLRMRNISSGFFLGHQFDDFNDEIIDHNFKIIPNCPLINPQRSCGYNFHHLKDLTIFHTIWNHTQLDLLSKTIFGNIPNNLYWYQNGVFPSICKMPLSRHLKERFNSFLGFINEI